MANVEYRVTLKGMDAKIITHHNLELERIENGKGDSLFKGVCLHPDADPDPFVFSVPKKGTGGEAYHLKLRGPANPDAPKIINYFTALVLPRRTGGAIDIVMPPIYTGDLHDGGMSVDPDDTRDDMTTFEPVEPHDRPDYAGPVELGAAMVLVRVTKPKGAHLPGYLAQLHFHDGGAMLTKRKPLDHANVGGTFRVRESHTHLWVTLYKGSDPGPVSSARLDLGQGSVVQVVFVIDAPPA